MSRASRAGGCEKKKKRKKGRSALCSDRGTITRNTPRVTHLPHASLPSLDGRPFGIFNSGIHA